MVSGTYSRFLTVSKLISFVIDLLKHPKHHRDTLKLMVSKLCNILYCRPIYNMQCKYVNSYNYF